MATSLGEVTYELSLRAQSQQEAALNELRTRTGVLLAATAIALALLGGRALDDGARTAIDLAGVALAVLSFLLSVFVLAPKARYLATIDAAAVHEYFTRQEVDVSEAMEALVYSNREVWEENQVTIDGLVRAFRWACLTLVSAVVSGQSGWRYSERGNGGHTGLEPSQGSSRPTRDVPPGSRASSEEGSPARPHSAHSSGHVSDRDRAPEGHREAIAG